MDVFGLLPNMMLQAGSSLPNFVTALQSEGRITFTRAEAIAALGITEAAFLKAADHTTIQRKTRVHDAKQTAA